MKNYTKQELIEMLAKKDSKIAELQEDLSTAIAKTEELKYEVETEKRKAKYAQKSFETIENSSFWKITKPARTTLDIIKDSAQIATYINLTGKVVENVKEHGLRYTVIKIRNRLLNAPSYSRWIRQHKPSAETISKQRNATFRKNIIFSIIVPLYNTPEKFLREMIESVQEQSYSGWELCLADGSDSEHKNVGDISREYCSTDNRIKYKKLEKNLGISGNTNACLEIATGDYIALFDHDDILHPSALYEMMCVICEKDADFVYTDEAVFISPNINKIKTIHFKPDYAPDNLRSNNYICHFSAFQKSLLDKVGGFRSECDGSQDHDLILRITEKATRVEHIPKVLYYWRAHPQSVAMSNNAKSYAAEGGKRAVLDSVKRMGMNATILNSRTVDSIYRIRYDLIGTPKISIIIHNLEKTDKVFRCIKSIEDNTSYSNYEIIVADCNINLTDINSSYKELIKSYDNIQVTAWDGNNIAEINNYAISSIASGDYILLLSSSIEVITPNWIEELLMFAQREDVGAVGPMLYYPDDSVYQAGLILGRGGIAAPAFRGLVSIDVGYMGRMCYAQNLSLLSADCILLRRDVWNRVGGMDENYPLALNDIDLCMRVRECGYLIVWTPFAELYKHDRKSKTHKYGDIDDRNGYEKEELRFKTRWADKLKSGDPYYNPNFSLDVSQKDFTL